MKKLTFLLLSRLKKLTWQNQELVSHSNNNLCLKYKQNINKNKTLMEMALWEQLCTEDTTCFPDCILGTILQFLLLVVEMWTTQEPLDWHKHRQTLSSSHVRASTLVWQLKKICLVLTRVMQNTTLQLSLGHDHNRFPSDAEKAVHQLIISLIIAWLCSHFGNMPSYSWSSNTMLYRQLGTAKCFVQPILPLIKC